MSDFVVYEWMLGRELDLGKCELVILGLVFSYNRTGMTMYKSEQSLADYANVSKRTVCTAIKKLMDQGLIVRSKEKHPKYRTYEYTVSEEVKRNYFNKDGVKISPMSVKKLHQEQCKIFTDAGEKTSTNKKEHSAIDNPRHKEDPSRVKRENSYGTNSNPALDVCNPAEYIRH